jgi:hypothetical protein
MSAREHSHHDDHRRSRVTAHAGRGCRHPARDD